MRNGKSYLLCAGYDYDALENLVPKATGKAYLIAGRRYNYSGENFENVSYLVYLPYIDKDEYSKLGNKWAHEPLEIVLSGFNAVNTQKLNTGELKTGNIRLYYDWGVPPYRFYVQLDDCINPAEVYVGEADVTQLSAAYIPVDGETIFINEQGKINVKPLANRIENVVDYLKSMGAEWDPDTLKFKPGEIDATYIPVDGDYFIKEVDPDNSEKKRLSINTDTFKTLASDAVQQSLDELDTAIQDLDEKISNNQHPKIELTPLEQGYRILKLSVPLSVPA
jgi:hypothetical protein